MYSKKKSKGLRRKRNAAHMTATPEPQVWITMMQDMAFAELPAMHAQIPKAERANERYSSRDRSLANALRVLRRNVRNLDQSAEPDALPKRTVRSNRPEI